MLGKKLKAINALREVDPGMSIKAATDLIEALPRTVLTGLTPEQAAEAVTKLEAAGCTVALL